MWGEGGWLRLTGYSVTLQPFTWLSPGTTDIVLRARSTLNVLSAVSLPRSTNSVTYLREREGRGWEGYRCSGMKDRQQSEEETRRRGGED